MTQTFLYAFTFFIVAVLLAKYGRMVVGGCKWWLRPTLWLIVRLPVFLVALYCVFASIELVYNLSILAWLHSTEYGYTGFRWWAIPFTPAILAFASLGFLIPLLGYFWLVPAVVENGKLALPLRLSLATLIVVGIPVLIYGVTALL